MRRSASAECLRGVPCGNGGVLSSAQPCLGLHERLWLAATSGAPNGTHLFGRRLQRERVFLRQLWQFLLRAKSRFRCSWFSPNAVGVQNPAMCTRRLRRCFPSSQPQNKNSVSRVLRRRESGGTSFNGSASRWSSLAKSMDRREECGRSPPKESRGFPARLKAPASSRRLPVSTSRLGTSSIVHAMRLRREY